MSMRILTLDGPIRLLIDRHGLEAVLGGVLRICDEIRVQHHPKSKGVYAGINRDVLQFAMRRMVFIEDGPNRSDQIPREVAGLAGAQGYNSTSQ